MTSQTQTRGTLRGFTLIELLVVITIIGILAAIALPNYIKAKDKAKEVQVKSSLHTIQVAIERYHTDFEKYPQWLMGGDREGWRVWHNRYDEPNPGLNAVFRANLKDILLESTYLDAYPRNPFVDNGTTVISQTGVATGPGGSHQPGDGDPRFGFRGDTMGNGLDHNMLFKNWYGYANLNFELEDALIATTNNNPASFGFSNGTNAVHYAMGGRRAVKTENGQQVVYTAYTHWPGNFFYHGIGEAQYTRKGWTIYRVNAFIKTEVNRYIMGAYGSYTTEGQDVIRIEGRNYSGQQVYYRFPPPWSAGALVEQCTLNNGLLPVIMGGGNNAQGPWFPPNRSVDYPNAFIYGAPDGYPDAVMLVLTAGEEVQAF